MDLSLMPFYHWSPERNYIDISRNGLVVFSESADHRNLEALSPYISLGCDSRTAWILSGDVYWNEETDEPWHLWQVTLTQNDDVVLRNDRTTKLDEVKVYNSIPSERCWFVAKREFDRPYFEEIKK